MLLRGLGGLHRGRGGRCGGFRDGGLLAPWCLDWMCPALALTDQGVSRELYTDEL